MLRELINLLVMVKLVLFNCQYLLTTVHFFKYHICNSNLEIFRKLTRVCAHELILAVL